MRRVFDINVLGIVRTTRPCIPGLRKSSARGHHRHGTGGGRWDESLLLRKKRRDLEMQRIALHTELKPGKEAEYERVHAVIPAELDAALRAAGVHSWRIWRDGQDLFHVVEVEDYRAMRSALRDHPANVVWQATMSELLAVEDDYSGADTGLKQVWELPGSHGA